METQKQKTTINTLYIMLVLSTILSFVPFMSAQLLSLVLVVVVLLAAYFYRGRDTEDGLMYNHMTYMIGTVWIGTSFLLLGMMAAGAWVFMEGNHSVIDAALVQVEGGFIPTEAEMTRIITEYMLSNKNLIVMSSIVTIGPAILYFVYRVANGFSRACKGYRIANPKSWL